MIVKNVSLIGHKDHGKSTLIGSLLMQTGAATKVRIKEAEAYSTRLGKPFEPAFILDSFAEEREQEMTYDTTRAEIKYKGIAFSLIDVPGHEELIKNMISGASYGDLAILMVSAKKGEGVRDQTKRHLFIAKMLGIDTLVVAVNKMDTVGYDRLRFEETKKELSGFIRHLGFQDPNVTFVPISAYKGENLIRPSPSMRWYKGRPLLEELRAFASGGKSTQGGPLRIIVQGSIPSGKEELVVGKVIKGTVHQKDRILILPHKSSASVDSITVKGKRVVSAKAGENVALKISPSSLEELRGSIISGEYDSPRTSSEVTAKVFVTGNLGKVTSARFNGVPVKCTGISVLHRISTTTGRIKDSRTAKALDAVEARILLERRVPVEPYSITRELGRFVLYSGSEFAGIGTVE